MKLKGFTNDVYIENDILIKESNDFHDFYLDRKNEYNFLIFLKNICQSCLLKPIDFFWKENKLVSKFLYLKDYKSLHEVKINKSIVYKVVDNIYQLHNLQTDNCNLKKFDYINFLNIFKNNLKDHIDIDQNEFDKLKNELIILENFPLVASHNDLVPGNILVNKNNLIFIDYDYVSLNNKFFDIASFITETLNENDELIKYFINQCIEKNLINKNEIKYLNLIIKYQDLLWTLWAKYMWEKKHEEIFKTIYNDKLNRYKKRKEY